MRTISILNPREQTVDVSFVNLVKPPGSVEVSLLPDPAQAVCTDAGATNPPSTEFEVPMSRFRSCLSTVAIFVCLAESGLARSAEKPPVQMFDSNGVKISYFVLGKGEPVVLIHGWLSSAGINWALPGTSDFLARDYQVIALDLRGHGQSDKPTKDESYGPELVEDVVRLLNHLEIKKAHVVGYSMGGIVAANFMAKHPDRVLSATLGGMGWLKVGGIAQFGFSRIGKDDSNAKPQALCGRSLGKLALTEDDIKSIRVPVTVLVGDKDNLIKKLYVEPLQKVRKDWPVVEIKDADHITCIAKPQFQKEIAAWLKKNAR
jgi:pimeloyl-ACP methyl ester carboxylesterase